MDTSAADDGAESEANPTVALQPSWVITTDSDGNIRKKLKLETDFVAGDHARIGVLLGEGFISSSHSTANSEDVRDLGLTGHWHPTQALKFDGMVGVSQADVAINPEEQAVRQVSVPVTKLQAQFAPEQGPLKLGLGFERSFYDLSPELVRNRVIRNQFVVHPELALPAGWRLRALAEMGPMTSVVGNNARYNSEFTVGHKLGKASELYSMYEMLHYAKGSDAGYFPPDLVQGFEGGWSTDIDRNAFSLSLDFGLGADHAREHGSSFGPWGVTGHAGSFLTWTIRERRELTASYEYYYDQSSPAVEPSPSGAWHMSVVTLAFRWATR